MPVAPVESGVLVASGGTPVGRVVPASTAIADAFVLKKPAP